MSILRILPTLAASTIALLFASCSSNTNNSNDNNSTQQTISGKLPKQVALARKMASISYDHIWATPLQNGSSYMMAAYVDRSVLVPVDAAGNFTLSVDSTLGDYILLLIDSKESNRANQVKGYITVGVGDESMLKLPINSMQGDSLNLGELSMDPNDSSVFKSDTNVTQQFTLSSQSLLTLARSDEALRAVKNLYINYDTNAAGSGLLVASKFRWNPTTIPDIINQYYNPTDIGNATKQYAFGVQGIRGNVTMNASTLSLTAPAPIIAFEHDPAQPETLSVIQAPYLLAPELNGIIEYSFMYFLDTIPAGIWTIQEGSEVRAVFDMGSAYQEDAQGRPMLCIPSPRITVDGDSVVTAVDVQWMIYNGNGYDVISDGTILNKIIAGDVHVKLASYKAGANYEQNEYADAMSISISAFDKTWSTGSTPPENATNLDELAISYQMNGMNYLFNFKAKESLYAK